jgi:hypothetical protein
VPVLERGRELAELVAAVRAATAGAGSVVALDALDEAYTEVLRRHAGQMRAELAFWLFRSGRPAPAVGGGHPYDLQMAGRWREAAAAWQAAGCPYEYAVALAESTGPDDLLAALETMEALGAEPTGSWSRSVPSSITSPRSWPSWS